MRGKHIPLPMPESARRRHEAILKPELEKLERVNWSAWADVIVRAGWPCGCCKSFVLDAAHPAAIDDAATLVRRTAAGGADWAIVYWVANDAMIPESELEHWVDRVHKHPTARPVVVVNLFTARGETLATAPLEGEPERLGAWHIDHPAETAGRLANPFRDALAAAAGNN